MKKSHTQPTSSAQRAGNLSVKPLNADQQRAVQGGRFVKPPKVKVFHKPK